MKVRKILAYSFSVFFTLIIWWIISLSINAPLILPDPVTVIKSMIKYCQKYTFWHNFGYTFLRILLAFFISLILGSFLGFITSLSEFLHDFFEFPLTIIRTTPIIAFILIAVFWFNSGTVPVFVAVLMTLPIITTSVYTGFTKTDTKLLNMAKAFNFTKFQVLRYIKIPNCRNYFLDGIQSSFGLTWKVIVAGEVISLPKYALGTMLQKSQVHLESSEVIAVTLFIVAFSFIIEKIMRLLFKRCK